MSEGKQDRIILGADLDDKVDAVFHNELCDFACRLVQNEVEMVLKSEINARHKFRT